MRWPGLWSLSTSDDERQPSGPAEPVPKPSPSPSQTPDRVDRNVLTEPQTILAAVALSAAFLGARRVYVSYLRRVPEAKDISRTWLQKRSILGTVTSVGDGDNFRLYHTPGGRLAGWGWLPGRRVPTAKSQLKGQTIHVRLAGIDAPELAHFGKPAQPYGQEALNWLRAYVLHRRVRVYVHQGDQYQRVVGTAYVWKFLGRRDVGLDMLGAGLATVYEAKTGAVFGPGLEPKYREAEAWAKARRKGMWAVHKGEHLETPREYKTRYGSAPP
ncbi:hypothetical protein DV735_g5907, partial [Chaetothyriales sp. CBS 134920]